MIRTINRQVLRRAKIIFNYYAMKLALLLKAIGASKSTRKPHHEEHY